MKQYVIINNTLKMSKGKIARVCLSLGVKSNNEANNISPEIPEFIVSIYRSFIVYLISFF